jgi:hypothetical protein
MAVNAKQLEKGLDKILSKTGELAMSSMKHKNYLNSEPTLWGELLFPNI